MIRYYLLTHAQNFSIIWIKHMWERNEAIHLVRILVEGNEEGLANDVHWTREILRQNPERGPMEIFGG